MKKAIYIVTACLCSVITGSCSLDEEVYSNVEKDGYMTSVDEAKTVLNGVYRTMVEEGMYRYHLSLLFTIPTDLARCEGSTTNNYRIIPANAYTATQDEVETTWESLYSGIYCANDFISELASAVGSFEEDEQAEAAVMMAEARCLRALYYFELVRWFGHVTLVTDPADSYILTSEFEQNDPEKIYEFIEEDLLYAIDVLPYASDDDIRDDNSYRFSKGAALGLLTKVYCTWAGNPIQDETKWEAAAKAAKVLVDSGKHALNEGSGSDGYRQLWVNTCNGVWEPLESLIEVSFYAPTITGTTAYDPAGRIGKWNGVTATGITGIRNAANWKVLPTFLQNWEGYQNDLRFSLSFADYKYTSDGKENVSSSGVFTDAMSESASDSFRKSFLNALSPAKWDTEEYVEESNYLVNQDLSNINWYILRYADVLLLYAEALNEWRGAPTAEAYEAVNMVRRRGYGLPISSSSSVADLAEGMTYSEFQEAVRKERAYELAFEGHRRQDLIRWGVYYETIMQTAQDMTDWHTDGATYYICAQYTQKNKHELLPIPQRDLDLMPLYEQNPGW